MHFELQHCRMRDVSRNVDKNINGKAGKFLTNNASEFGKFSERQCEMIIKTLVCWLQIEGFDENASLW